jgi:HlyD family secretion protein
VKVRILKESYNDLTEGKPESYSPFRPGMTATVDIITDRRSNAISAPISAIVIKTDTSTTKRDFKQAPVASSISEEKFECVFIASEGKAKLRVVKTGIQDDTNIEVVSGLEENDEIITGPYNLVSKTLKSGDAIEIQGSNNGNPDSEESSE